MGQHDGKFDWMSNLPEMVGGENILRAIVILVTLAVLVLVLWLGWKWRRPLLWLAAFILALALWPITIPAAIWWWVTKRDLDAKKSWNEHKQRVHGTARHGTLDDLDQAAMRGAKAEGLIVGMVGDNGMPENLIRYNGTAHLLTIAPTGSGKGVSAIITNLLDYPGGVIVIDPKGENAAVTARRRRDLGQAVHVLDPWGLSGIASASFNPLDLLDPTGPDFAEDAMMLADSLVVPSGGDSHWDNEARALIAGVLMYIATHEPPERRNLPRLYHLLSLPAEKFEKLLNTMMKSPQENVQRAGARMNQKAEKEASSVISSAQANLHFLDSPRMASVLERSDFDLATLKTNPASLFLVLPADRLQTFNRWLRLMVSVTLAALARDRQQPAHPVLFLLDEFAALGHLRPVETAVGLLRGHGVKIWPILQDLSQIKAHYPRSWESFLANAGAIQVFGTNDQGTAEYFSKMSGTQTMSAPSDGPAGMSVGQVARALFTPDEIRRIDEGSILLFIQQHPVYEVGKPRYYQLAHLTGLYDPNPYRQNAKPHLITEADIRGKK